MHPLKTLVLLFPEFNTLDMNGPVETLHAPDRGGQFNITIASETDMTTAAERVTVQRHIPLDSDLIDTISDYDLLVVPGGPVPDVEAQAAKKGEPFLDIIEAFASLESTQERPRTILSICSGAIFLATMGVFNDMYCTSHWSCYGEVEEHAAAAAAKSPNATAGKVLAARYVDAGLNTNGVRVISSGGVSAGIDASLHLINLYLGEERQQHAAAHLDYHWKKTEGVAFV